MEIASFADVPAGTGMGSSSAFTVCLLHALYALSGRNPSAAELAKTSCHIEIDRAREPIGKQDQYATAFAGLNCIRFHPDESVEVSPIACSNETRQALQNRLMLFYTGGERAASSILQEQGRNMSQPDKFSAVVEMTKLAEELCAALGRNQIDSFGEILHAGWLLKSKLARDITNSTIESNYRGAREAGADGGKLLGAGSGGFLLLYCHPGKQSQVRETLAHLQEMPFAMSQEGSQVIHNDGQNDPILAARPPILSNK